MITYTLSRYLLYPVFDQVFEKANMLTLYYFTTIRSGYSYRDAINRSFISGDKYRLWSDGSLAFTSHPLPLISIIRSLCIYWKNQLIWLSFFSAEKNVRFVKGRALIQWLFAPRSTIKKIVFWQIYRRY